MISRIKKTGLSFDSGMKLSASDLRIMNSTINALVDVVNELVMSKYDLNFEIGNFERTFTLDEAIRVVSEYRRQLGMKIRFKSPNGFYAEYSYCGETLDTEEFQNPDKWVAGIDVIDGGEF